MKKLLPPPLPFSTELGEVIDEALLAADAVLKPVCCAAALLPKLTMRMLSPNLEKNEELVLMIGFLNFSTYFRYAGICV